MTKLLDDDFIDEAQVRFARATTKELARYIEEATIEALRVTETRRWQLSELQPQLGELAMELQAIGYTLALTGEVLLTGRGKELGIVLLALPVHSDSGAIERVFAKLFNVQRYAYTNISRDMRFWVDGKQINVIIK